MEWKTLTVTDSTTGNVIAEKKFRKVDFNEILEDPEYKDFLDDLIEKAMVKILSTEAGVDIDPESYEEIRALADELDVDL